MKRDIAGLEMEVVAIIGYREENGRWIPSKLKLLPKKARVYSMSTRILYHVETTPRKPDQPKTRNQSDHERKEFDS